MEKPFQKSLILFALVAAVMGCASNGAEETQKINALPGANFAASPTEVIKSGKFPSTDIDLETKIKGEVTKDSPLLYLPTKEKIGAGYKVFQINLDKGNYEINFRSYCNCLGWRNFLFVPAVFVMDKNGKSLITDQVTPPLNKIYDTPVHFIISVKTLEKGPINILVAADNRHKGKSVGKLSTMPYYGGGVYVGPIALDYQGYPYGDFDFMMVDKSKPTH